MSHLDDVKTLLNYFRAAGGDILTIEAPGGHLMDFKGPVAGRLLGVLREYRKELEEVKTIRNTPNKWFPLADSDLSPFNSQDYIFEVAICDRAVWQNYLAGHEIAFTFHPIMTRLSSAECRIVPYAIEAAMSICAAPESYIPIIKRVEK